MTPHDTPFTDATNQLLVMFASVHEVFGICCYALVRPRGFEKLQRVPEIENSALSSVLLRQAVNIAYSLPEYAVSLAQDIWLGFPQEGQVDIRA